MSGVAEATGEETSQAGCQLYLIGPPAVDLDVLAPALEATLAAGDIAAFRLPLTAATRSCSAWS